MKTFASLVVSIASIAGLCSTANMLLFRVFADMVERNHVFILRMALQLRSAVADGNPLNYTIGEGCGLGGRTF